MALATTVDQAWTVLDPANVDRSSRILAGALVPVVQQHAMAARGLANEYYQQERAISGIAEPFMPEVTALPTPQKVYQYVAWATKPARQAAPADVPQLLAPAKTNLTGGLQRLVANTGRQQILDNTLSDRYAIGFARETRPDCCWFCAMLATRGAVYRSAWSAGRRTFEGVDFNSYHTHCHCQVQPLFAGFTYQAPAHVQDAQQLWKDSTGGVYGEAKMTAFAAAYRAQHADSV